MMASGRVSGICIHLAVATVSPMWIVPVLAAPLMTTVAQAQDADAVFQRAVAQYKAAKTLRITFQQTLTNAMTGATSSAQGELLRKHPDLFAINFSDPATDRIVNDGKSIWLYLPSTTPGQVIKMPVKGTNEMLVDPLGHILSSSKDRFTVKSAGQATINGQMTRALTLTPTTQGMMFTWATIWIGDKDGRVHQIETKETSGLQRKILITKYIEGTSIAGSSFQFKVPKKVRVIDQSALSGAKR